MREKRSFAERTKVLNSDEVKKKYFLVYEGKETEDIYFQAIDTFRTKVGIDPLIEFIPVIRSYSEEGWSNPRKILGRIIQNIEEAETGEIIYETLLNWIMDYFQENYVLSNNRPLARYYWDTLHQICREKMNVSLNDQVEDIPVACKTIAKILKNEFQMESVISDIPRVMDGGSFTYSKDLDKICLIVDRDKDSFTSEQYEQVKATCESKHVGFYVTNPCFEFWLLMHFDDVLELNQEMLVENPKVTSKRRYCEDELRKRIPRFKKGKYDASQLMQFIYKAIENEKLFSEDIDELKGTIGSNIGTLITEMQK